MQVLRLHRLREELAAAAHGSKRAVVAAAAAELGISTASVHRWLSQHLRHDSGRARRADAGECAVTHEELQNIAAALYGTFRKTGRRIMTFDTAIEMLRANGRIDTSLSASRIATLLTEAGLHPSQMVRPTPALEQRSLHPNHVWQVDASVCVAYYLSNLTGLQVMREEVYNKNKPRNFSRIQHERLIRYTVADHYTHQILTRYYLGSECAAHVADFLIWAFAPKLDAGGQPAHIVHGVPMIVQLDMGAANTSAPLLNLLERLQVQVITHDRHNSRANGSVEKAHHLVELDFESRLRFAHVPSLQALNAHALAWSHQFGATRVHSRYKRTRHTEWLGITAEQLRLAPPQPVMRDMVTTHPEKRRVDNNLSITFVPVRGQGSRDFSVRYVPGVVAGMWLDVVVNPYRLPAVNVGYSDEATGEQRWMVVEPNLRGADGRLVDAPTIGEEQRAAPRGLLERNRDALRLLAYAHDVVEQVGSDAPRTERLAAAEAAHEKGALVFGGAVDPFKPIADTAAGLPAYLPRRGTPLDAPARQVAVARLSAVEACSRIHDALARVGQVAAYDASTVYAWLAERWGDAGMPEDQLDAACRVLIDNAARNAAAGDNAARNAAGDNAAPVQPVPLRAVGGGAL
ncbi:MAG: DDE-type integrase/transposase/recombinase [Ideonella sp.]|nr:DDE-type integrase/transposase/recombinase [Ideonella sp.]MCC7455959.1 DDE-type integrase/transposase/recombinase [Nitrospira sp.]